MTRKPLRLKLGATPKAIGSTWPKNPFQQMTNRSLAIEALEKAVCLKLDYHGQPRIAEVHTVGTTTKGRPAMSAIRWTAKLMRRPSLTGNCSASMNASTSHSRIVHRSPRAPSTKRGRSNSAGSTGRFSRQSGGWASCARPPLTEQSDALAALYMSEPVARLACTKSRLSS